MTSDESSLSSNSRIRQFGLYRSIDARTEEFLRLSRKRQIRQGCACAAASAAITVTVVIVIFFVYEFSLNSGTSLENSLKSGWLSLMNDTSEDFSFDPKLKKANIDNTTLKLLPLLIKAIKKNAVLEKLFDEHSNLSPFYDKKYGKEAIDDSYKRNTLTQNWLKTPSTKLYAIEYKTYPVVYYRDPTKNIEYYTKVRKIRDNQRVFNYVDKMISEKVYIRSSRHMQKEESHTESNFNLNYKKTTHTSPKCPNKLTNVPKSTQEETKFRCKCPQNLRKLLQKIINSLQNLLPEGHSKTKRIGCEKNEKITAQKTTAINNMVKTFSQIPVFFLQTTTTEELTRLYSKKPQQSNNTFISKAKSATESDKFRLNNKKNSLEPRSDEHFTMLEENSKEYIKTQNNSQPITTSPNKFINKYKNIINQKQILRHVQLAKKSKNIIEPIFDGIEYDEYDYHTTTSRNKPLINNKIHYIATKVNYLQDIILKKYKKNTNIPIKYKKKNKHASKSSKKSTNLDMQVIDNKIALVKTKPTHTNRINLRTPRNDSSISFTVFYKVLDTSTPLPILNKITTEEPIAFDYVNSKSHDLSDIHNTNLTKNDEFDSLIHSYIKRNLATLKPTYFRNSAHSQDKQTIYNLVKNNIQTFLNKTLKTKQVSNKINHSIAHKELKAVKSSKIGNKTAIYVLIKKHLNTLLRKKNLNTIKAKLKKTKAILKKANQDKSKANMSQKLNKTPISKQFDYTIFFTTKNNNLSWFEEVATTPVPDSYMTTMSTRNKFRTYYNDFTSLKPDINKPLLSSPDSDDDGEFSITDITKPVEYSIYKNSNDTSIENKTQDLTWEDLTNEFMPAWRSIIPDPTIFRSNKPFYLDYHKTDDKLEDQQEEDFNINSNFYDLNM